MAIPSPAVDHYKRMQRLQSLGKLQARRAWSQVQVGIISPSWETILRNSGLVAAMSTLQEEAAIAGASYGASTLAAQGLYEPPQAFVNPAGFAGSAPDGRPLDGLMYSAAPRTKRLIGEGMEPQQAKIKGGAFLELVASTVIADAGRAASGVDTASRKGVGYTRMLNPPSCDRCSILAGRYYPWNAGFQRHPGCDCVHVQTRSAEAAESEGLITDPYEYFNGLAEADQNRIYGKANAQAVRDGGDIFQVVNSKRGMKPGGLITTEGTSKRGAFGANRGRRLTPEGIYQKGLSRADTLQELERYGYILPGGQNPHGVIRGLNVNRVAPGRYLTAAEQRAQTAVLRWEALQEGRNPYGSKRKLTPKLSAAIEDDYRRIVVEGNEVAKITARRSMGG